MEVVLPGHGVAGRWRDPWAIADDVLGGDSVDCDQAHAGLIVGQVLGLLQLEL